MKAKNFFICGIAGWCMEILFTCAKAKDKRLIGQTSLWMFPIYGLAACILPVYQKIKKIPAIFRTSIYSLGIFSCEYVSGSILKKYSSCPWDYSDARLNVNGLIRPDYAPLWMAAGLVFEQILIFFNPTER